VGDVRIVILVCAIRQVLILRAAANGAARCLVAALLLAGEFPLSLHDRGS
jgi:hypothetical protein